VPADIQALFHIVNVLDLALSVGWLEKFVFPTERKSSVPDLSVLHLMSGVTLKGRKTRVHFFWQIAYIPYLCHLTNSV